MEQQIIAMGLSRDAMALYYAIKRGEPTAALFGSIRDALDSLQLEKTEIKQ